MLFSCAWEYREDDENLASLKELIRRTCAILPCQECRNHYEKNQMKASRRLGRDIHNGSDVFEWLYWLKDEVNRSQRRKSHISLYTLRSIYTFHGPYVDEVKLADALVCFAMFSKEKGETQEFNDLCHTIHSVLPVARDSQFLQHLKGINPTATLTGSVRCAQAARAERGVPVLSLQHYRRSV